MATSKQIISLDFHDLELHRPGLEDIVRIKEHLPNLKVTLFMVPIASSLVRKIATTEDYQEWADWLKAQEWIEVCPHGMTHAQAEMLYLPGRRERLVDYETAKSYIQVAEHTFEQLGLPYKKIWASPFWQTSPEVYRALWDMGYTVAVDPNQPLPEGGPIYIFDWSIDKPFPIDRELVKGHGHMYPPSANAVNLCLENLLDMASDAEFKFVSEILDV